MNTILLLIGLTLTQANGDTNWLTPLPPIEATLMAANSDESAKEPTRHSLVETLEKQNESDFKEQVKKAESLPVPNVQNHLPSQLQREETEARAIKNLKGKPFVDQQELLQRLPLTDSEIESIEKVDKEEASEFPKKDFMLNRLPALSQEKLNEVNRRSLTIQEARRMTFANSPDIEMAKARLEKAIAGVVTAKSEFFPTLSFEYDLTHFHNFDSATTSGSDGPHRVGADFEWSVFEGFRRKFELISSQLDDRSARYGICEALRLLQHAMNQAYYAAILSQERMTIAEQNLQFNQTLADFVQRRRASGMASKSEYLNFMIKAGEARREYLSSQRDYGVLLAVLGALMNVTEPLDSKKIRLVRPAQLPVELTDANFKASLQHAIRNRPDLTQQTLEIRKSDAMVGVAQSDYWPMIDFESNYSLGSSEEPNLVQINNEALSAGLVISWDLFQGFRRPAQVAAQRANTSQLKATYRRSILDLIGQLKGIEQRINLNEQLVDNQTKTHAYATEDRELVLKLYEASFVSITRLNEVQKDYVHSAERLALAQISLEMARDDYEIALGLLEPEAQAACRRVTHQIHTDRRILSGLPRVR
jgi:outer membrane protein TolC